MNGSEEVSMCRSHHNLTNEVLCIMCMTILGLIVYCVYILEHIGRFDYEKNEIVVFRKKNKSSKLTSFSGRGVINAPYTAVAEFIKDIDSSFVWDKFLVVR